MIGKLAGSPGRVGPGVPDATRGLALSVPVGDGLADGLEATQAASSSADPMARHVDRPDRPVADEARMDGTSLTRAGW
ncbi:MAG TPA: hypothetical protein VF153_05130 [Candidatus Limnocylindria bacterium]